MKRFVLATRNADKVREIREALDGLGFEVIPASALPGAPEVAEDGATLEVNALKKARALSDHSGLPAVADDTGLFVEALNGRPGVHSARYAGPACDDRANVDLLLSELRGLPEPRRKAFFRTVIAWCGPKREERVFSGEVHGHITADRFGNGGFGYDPVFLPAGEQRTFAQMSLEEKNAISHRGRAVAELRRWLSGV
jgi:XTP/dITP diphosphohydrolase